MKLFLYTDGGARGNPGPAALGIVIKNESGDCVKELGLYIGNATNNDAEYQALIQGLEECTTLGGTSINCTLDSELIVRQLNGAYKVKNPRMKKYWSEVKGLEKQFDDITYEHVTRDNNAEADGLVNKVLDTLQNA